MIKIRNESGSVITVPTLKGVDGKSAYEYAVEAGFEGSEQDFINLLVTSTDMINTHMEDAEAHSDIRELTTKSNTKINEITDKLGNLDELDTETKEDLVSAINEVKDSINEITILAGAVVINEDYSNQNVQRSYKLIQNNKLIGTIEIPKDTSVVSGRVVIDPIGQDPGTYIQLSLSNTEKPVYININTIDKSFKTESNPKDIQVSIDRETGVISAVMINGSVTTDKIANNAITTDKIADKAVTTDKLSKDIQDTLSIAATGVETAKAYTDSKIDALVGTGASETLDTIGEISKAITDNKDVINTLNTSIGNKVDKVAGKGLSTNDYTTDEKTKLAGIAAGAEVNQNTFSNVVVGSTTIAANSKTDALTLDAGNNIVLTPDADNGKITISMAIPVNPTSDVISALPVGGMYIIS